MRARPLGMLILAGALLGGCATTAAGQPSVPRDALTITCDEFAAPARGEANEPVERTVTVAAGEAFQITLCSNPSTGFGWEEPTIAGPAGITLVERRTVPAAGSMVGSPGSETFTFRTASAGTGTIDFAYSRPWEGGEKGAWTVQVSVVAS